MALDTITEIDLDVNQPGINMVYAMQYDTVRRIKANLFYGGIKWTVPTSNYIAVVAFKKSDRNGGFYDHTEDGELAVSVDTDRSIIYIRLDRNVVTIAGNVHVEITFYDSITNGRLSTFSFIVQVQGASLTELDLSSNSYFNVLAEKIAAVLQAEAKLTGVTASATDLAPSADATVNVSGGDSAANPYHFSFGIPSFPGLDTPTATKLAEGSSPTVTVTGGTTVTVTGGTTETSKYKFAFGIPKGDKGDTAQPVSSANTWATTASGTIIPSSWSATPDPQAGMYLWCRTITTWDNNATTTHYSVSYISSGSVDLVDGQTGEVETHAVKYTPPRATDTWTAEDYQQAWANLGFTNDRASSLANLNYTTVT